MVDGLVLDDGHRCAHKGSTPGVLIRVGVVISSKSAECINISIEMAGLLRAALSHDCQVSLIEAANTGNSVARSGARCSVRELCQQIVYTAASTARK